MTAQDDGIPSYTASAPATIMLTGEHAVLHGQPALVAAISKRLYVRLKPREDNVIEIVSDKLGHYATKLREISVMKPFHFVLGVLKHFDKKMETGCTIEIESEFSHQVGFGSSAAITSAMVYVMQKWLSLNTDKMTVFKVAKDIIHSIQGLGSGADVAASVFGKVVYYCQSPLKIVPLDKLPPLSLVYIGFKTPTPEVVKLVQKRRQEAPAYFEQLFTEIGICTEQCRNAILDGDWTQLGKYFNEHQNLQKSLGVSTEDIDDIIKTANSQDSVYGSKISGSGLGDCIVCLGSLPKCYFPRSRQQRLNGVQQYEIQLSPYGLLTDRLPSRVTVYG